MSVIWNLTPSPPFSGGFKSGNSEYDASDKHNKLQVCVVEVSCDVNIPRKKQCNQSFVTKNKNIFRIFKISFFFARKCLKLTKFRPKRLQNGA